MRAARDYHRMALECLELAEAARDSASQDALIRMAEFWASLAGAVFEAADGRIILAVGNDAQFRRWCAFAGAEDLAADPRFATNPLRVANREALYAFLHTDLLFSKEKDEHARALAQIARIWRELNRPDRADETLERLKQEYPRSPYATAAAPK